MSEPPEFRSPTPLPAPDGEPDRAGPAAQLDAVADLWRAGLPWTEIARRVGYADPRMAVLTVTAQFHQMDRDRAAADRFAGRLVELERQDSVVAAQWDAAMRGDAGAARTVLAALGRSIRLWDLDRPAAAAGVRPRSIIVTDSTPRSLR